MIRCIWTGSDHPRALADRHEADCPGDCAGCWPCPERHCLRCGVVHAETVCPACIASVRCDLVQIVQRYAELGDEAEARGIDSVAFVLAGPCADPEARGHLEASVAVGRVPDDRAEEILPRDQWHPLWVLESWAGIWREVLGHDEPTTRATVEGAAGYLQRNLSDVAAMPEVEFADFAREVGACLGNLESVLHDRAQTHKGAPCPTCDPARALTAEGVGEERTWVCMGCRQSWDEDDYRGLVRAGYLAKAEVLHVDDLAERTGVPRGTIRCWAAPRRRVVNGTTTEFPPLIYAAGKSPRGRAMYRVADVIAIRDRETE